MMHGAIKNKDSIRMVRTKPTFLAIIPARGGSKGIKNKNIRMFCGRPLLWYSIREAKRSKYVDRIIISTESKNIASVARKCGAEVPFLRPKELAHDRSVVFDAVKHLLEILRKKEGYAPDYVVLLQPTSPLRTAEDIDGAIDMLLFKNAESVVSVTQTEPLVFTRTAGGELCQRSDTSFLLSPNRQELPSTYRLDGSMVYVIHTEVLLRTGSFVPKGTLGYVIARWRAVDVDEPQDFVVGELLYRHRAKLAARIRDFK